MSDHGPEPGWADRYQLRELIGRGAMGLVYRAHDVDLGHDVALKTLGRSHPEDLYHLKREFRALAGLAHPHLVELYDLVVAGAECFFTMELLDAVDFVTHVRGHDDASTAAPLSPGGCARLRATLPQLVDGLCALHAARKLHRDVKPSNVLVTANGRVVLVDFGLVAERVRDTGGIAGDGVLTGTLPYMAPEQAWGRRPTPAADWYSVGVVLYQTLTGRLPRESPLARDTPPPPASGLDELDRLALALLRPAPEERPTAPEIASAVGLGTEPAAVFPSTATLFEAPFVGREVELAALHEAWARVRAGAPAVVHVPGPSGIGKTALLQRLLDDVLAEDPPPRVLSGRCRPQESVPFEALDSLVDSLSRLLVAEPPPGEWLPAHPAALLRLFPVLARVDPLAGCAGEAAAEPLEVRRQAFVALRQLLAALARERPLVLWIDDLQWGDLDSAAFLRDLADVPPPGLLVVFSYRSEDRDTSPLLRALDGGAAVAVPIGPLPAREARRLAGHLIPYPAAAERLDAIAAESGGSPFLACELARWVASHGMSAPAGLALDDVVAARVEGLPGAAQRLLEVVALSPGPLAQTVAAEAADVARARGHAVSALRRHCLLREGALADDPVLEIYHERIRESVVARLSDDGRRAHHARLVQVLAARRDPDPLALLHHSRGAGQTERAIHYATLAAEQAARALAFNQAARLYGLALELGPDDDARGRLLARRADALANAGLAAEAGDCYGVAADHLAAGRRATDPQVLHLRRCAAEQHLRSGRFDDGLRGLRDVLRASGFRYPETTRAAVAATVVHRTVLRARGLGHRLRPVEEIAPAVLARLDAYWSSAVGLVWVDPIRSADFQGRHTRLALRVGEPTRVVRALATEGAFLAALGGARNHRRSALALAAARNVATRLDDPPSLGLTGVCEAVSAYFAGRFGDAVPLARAAERTLRERCVGVAWERTNCHIAMLWSLAYGGEIAVLDRLVPDILREAADRGDLLATASLAAFIPENLRHLAADAVDRARAQAAAAIAGWPPDAFLLPHYYALYSQTQIDLYAGEPDQAWSRLEAAWGALEASMLLRFQVVRTDAGALRARTALAAALAADGTLADGRRRRTRLVRAALREAACLDAEDMPWCAPWVATIRAGAALASGDRDAAALQLGRAAAAFDRAGMGLMAALARLRAGTLGSDDTARRLRAVAGRWLDGQGVRNPAAMARLLLPEPA